jgi:PKD repeat protein
MATTSVSITVNAPPDVAITGPQTGALYQSGAPVTLTGTASDSEDGDLSAAIQWSSSQDGALGSGASINVSSLSAGSHVITASVTDTGGKTVTSSTTVTVNAAPVVTITSPPNGAEFGVGDAVNLTGTATDPEDGNLASSMQWRADNVTIGTGASINASSLAVGSHMITASVTDTQGGTDSRSIVVTVTAPVPPQASFSFTPATGTAPLLVSFTDTSTGDITSWAWSFTSGTGGSTGPNVTHTFPTPGAYTATLTVNGPGGTSSATRAIVVTTAPPVASFTATPSIGIAPLTVSFTDQSTGSITSWAWSFSDGGSATGQNVYHTFTTPGAYTATLSVTGPGGTSQFQRGILVSSPGSGDPGGGRDPGDPGGGRDGPPPEKIPG